MTKVIFSVGLVIAVFAVAQSAHNDLSHFKAIKAYEVRPGILMLPRYAADGQVCEMWLEKLHHSGEGFTLGPSLAQTEVDQIADQLVPANERGPRPQGLLEQGMTSMSGHSALTTEEYENIAIYIYGAIDDTPDKNKFLEDDIAATIKWKHRTCAEPPTGTATK
jgi:hypothetical protein